MIPDTHGIELSKKIKEKYNLDVILVTGNLEGFSYTNAIETGATDFINKPVSIQE